MGGERAKGLVGVDGWRERQGCGVYRWTEGEARVRCVSMDGGRGKGAVDIGRQNDKSEFGELSFY